MLPEKLNTSAPNRPSKREKAVAGNIALMVSREAHDIICAAILKRYRVHHGEHITLKLGVKEASDDATKCIGDHENAAVEIYGAADDNKAVQCLLVRVNGKVADERGRLFHLTWSLNPDVEVPGCYNDVISRKGDKIALKEGAPGPARARHSAYIATKEECVTLWPESDIIRLQMSPRFYPEASTSQTATASAVEKCRIFPAP
jgi:hypothetical protein